MKKSYYKKLLFMYSAVFFVLTLLFSGIYFVNANHLESERINEQNRVLFQAYVRAEEEKLAGMIRNSNKIASLDSTMSYAISNGTNYYRKMADLRDDLSMLGGVGTKTSYFVQKKNDNNCVTNYQSTPISILLDEFGISKTEYDKIISEFGKNDLKNYQFIYANHGILYLTTKTINNNRVQIGVFTIYDQVRKYDEHSYASFCVTKTGGGRLRSPVCDVTDLRTSYSVETGEGEWIKELAGDSQTVGEFKEGNDHYYYIDSQYNYNRYYLKTIDRSPTAADSVMNYAPFVLITTVLGFAVILFISKRLYAPIENLVNILIDMEDQDIETAIPGNDIEYLAKKVSKIRHDNKDLTKTLMESQNKSRNHLILEILRGTFDKGTAQEELRQYGLEWLNEVNYIVSGGTVLQDTDGGDEIHTRISAIVKENLDGAFQTACVNRKTGDAYYIVQSETLEGLEEVLSGLVAAVNTALGLDMVFYVSKRSKRIEDLHYAFMTLEKVRENSLSEGKRAIYDFRDVKQSLHPAAIYSVSIENKLLSSIEKGNAGEMESILDYIFKEYASMAFMNEQSKNMLIAAFANTANRCLERFSILVSDVLDSGDHVFAYLNQCTDMKDFEERSQMLFQRIYNYACSSRDLKVHELKPQIDIYMKKNILNDISLVSMADYFKLTPNYMSAVFKSVMGETFKDCTSRYRFELGVEYLSEHPDITLAELAEVTGINSTATLIRLFKKHAGCSPSQYVQKINRK